MFIIVLFIYSYMLFFFRLNFKLQQFLLLVLVWHILVLGISLELFINYVNLDQQGSQFCYIYNNRPISLLRMLF